ncbi:MAG: winged helix-turn-helix domain-containing protein [Chloroflexota bacterium]
MSVVESPRQPRPPRARQLDRRSALLAALRAADRPMSVEEVAASAGIAASTAQFHLSILVSAGDVTRAPSRRGAAGRPSWQYTASTGPGPANAYEDLARVLAAQLDAGAGRPPRHATPGGAGPTSSLPEAPPPGAHGRRRPDAPPRGARRPRLRPRRGWRRARDRAARLSVRGGRPRAPRGGLQRALGPRERTAAAIGGGIAIEGLEPFREDQPLACAVRLAQPS